MLYHPAITVGTTSNFANPWKGPFIIEKCFNNVTIKTEEEFSSRQQVANYGQLKPFFEPPPTSNVPTRNKQGTFQSTQYKADTHEHIDGTVKHDDCLSFLPAPSIVFTPTAAQVKQLHQS